MSTIVTYKGNTLTTVNNTTKTLKTAGKYMEGDVVLADSTTIEPLNVVPNKSMQTFDGKTYSVIESIRCETSAVITTAENLTNQLTLGKTYKAHIQWWYQPYDTVLINEGDYEFVCSSAGYTIQKNSTTVKIYPTYVTGFKGSANINSEWVIIEISELSTYDGYLPITVDPIPSEYIIPTGTKSITENGTGIDVAQYASVNVAIPAEFDVPTFYTEDWETFTCDKTYAECLALFNNGEHGAILTSLSETSSGMTEVSRFLIGYTQRDDDGPLRYCFVRNGVPIAQIEYVRDGTVNVFSPPTSVQNLNVTANGTYNSGQDTVWNEVTVNVPESELYNEYVHPTLDTQIITPSEGKDGFSRVTVYGFDLRTQYKTVTPSTSQQYITPDRTAIQTCVSANGENVSESFPTGISLVEGNLYIIDGTVTYAEHQRTYTESIASKLFIWDGTEKSIDITNSIYTKFCTATITANSISTTTANADYSGSTVTLYQTSYHGLSDVTVRPIPSNYIGSDIAQRSSTDLTTSGATVTVPAGYYSAQASKTVASGSATINSRITTTPSISINEDGLVTADLNGSVGAMPVVTEGYITAGTTGSISYIGSKTLQLDTQAATTITPTEEPQTAVVTGKYTIGAVTVGAIPSTYIGTSINQRNSDDLTVSGATVTVPAGYYNEVASKSVETMTYNKSNNSVGTLWDSINATPTMQYLNFSKGYLSENKYIRVWTSSGSATAPASITGTAATISTGTNTLTLTKSVSVTPSVTAGYVSSGTAGNSSVSLTASVSTKAAATITPSTTDQTIAAGTYLTGTQTIAGDADLIASNIISTANIFGVQGSVVVQNYYTGNSEPSSSLGQNGDIYIQQ